MKTVCLYRIGNWGKTQHMVSFNFKVNLSKFGTILITVATVLCKYSFPKYSLWHKFSYYSSEVSILDFNNLGLRVQYIEPFISSSNILNNTFDKLHKLYCNMSIHVLDELSSFIWLIFTCLALNITREILVALSENLR